VINFEPHNRSQYSCGQSNPTYFFCDCWTESRALVEWKYTSVEYLKNIRSSHEAIQAVLILLTQNFGVPTKNSLKIWKNMQSTPFWVLITVQYIVIKKYPSLWPIQIPDSVGILRWQWHWMRQKVWRLSWRSIGFLSKGIRPNVHPFESQLHSFCHTYHLSCVMTVLGLVQILIPRTAHKRKLQSCKRESNYGCLPNCDDCNRE